MKKLLLILGALIILLNTGCNSDTHSMQVTATAYTSNIGETDDTPTLAAWGDQLKPGMKAIAVSRDLVKLGLTHKSKVAIDGLSGHYQVVDKMNKRWDKRIDIYMGTDTEAAKKWGKQQVIIHWKDTSEQ